MKKKDMYLNFGSGKGKRKFSGPKKERSKIGTRSKLFLLVVACAIGVGSITYATVNKKQQDKLAEEKNLEQWEWEESNEQGKNPIIAGPYGIWGVVDEIETSEEEDEVNDVWMRDFIEQRVPTKVKGIYLTASKANSTIDELIALVDETELNTMVIDIKDDDGRITFLMDDEKAIEINATKAYISDIDALIRKLKQKNIYLIARVVAFKDPVLAEKKPELALQNKDGTTFRDKDGLAWVNPYKKEVWDYLVGIASKCAEIGFDEVNFDYIRFSTDSGMKKVDFGEEAINKTKIETITEFVKYACENLRDKGIYVSADVYGAIISSSVDAKIVGQSYVEMAKYLDYICPMIYPSHYGDGYYGIDYPDTKPYELIMGALGSSNKALDEIPEGEHRAIVRPWLQDFTATWLKHYIRYEAKEVREQIEAVYDSGYEEWLLWNGAMNYTEEALMTEDEAKEAFANRPTPTPLPVEEEVTLPTPVPNVGQFIDSPWKASD